ncbi:hypothetical protein ICN84_03620 [Akkermansia glycaniphila]|uniref:FKBP-type peptidyl-prolyl cis-trans isomerase N-terminal domain-containing protein n=1 Tax=Akkermansia glycaniphila TaxID=1679444 RepID=UPI001C021C43|nr:FKBP-type peptidyl-prolyl cis-trans isomerase N-terminal domain-containing protein [Akkermansia glycaniphila]MBT9449161.1 hypothetical protein [Akkermansia glycaniphila]
MNLPILASLFPLLAYTVTTAETPSPEPIRQASAAVNLDANEIIRQYSIYLGTKTADIFQNDPLDLAASSLADPDIIRQSVLAHLDKPRDNKQFDEEFERISKIYEEALQTEEIEMGKTFMRENAKRPGVVSLPIGIQYEVIPDPEGNNRRLDEMNTYKVSTASGRCFDGVLQDSHSLSDLILPSILTSSSALQNMPKGRELILYIPAELLSPSKTKGIEKKASIVIYSFTHKEKDGNAQRTNPVHTAASTIKRIPADLRRKYGELLGERLSHAIRKQWSAGSSQDADPVLIRQTFFDHLDKPCDRTALENRYQDIIRQYDTIHHTRQMARDRNFIRENARKSGVIVLSGGIQYTVEKDPAGRNLPFLQSSLQQYGSLSGTLICLHGGWDDFSRMCCTANPGAQIGFTPGQENAEEYGMRELLGADLDRVEAGRKWIFFIPFERLSEQNRTDLKNSWREKCPEYIVHTFEAEENPPPPSDKDAAIEDDAPPASAPAFDLMQKPDLTAESLARYETLFLRLNTLTPNVTVLPNGIQYSYITDPDGRNSSIKQIDTMRPQTLTGDYLYSHTHLNLQNTRPDGTGNYTHPLIEPYLDDLPEAKKWFFCIPAEMIDPSSMEWYEQRIGVRPHYILYTLEADKKS